MDPEFGECRCCCFQQCRSPEKPVPYHSIPLHKPFFFKFFIALREQGQNPSVVVHVFITADHDIHGILRSGHKLFQKMWLIIIVMIQKSHPFALRKSNPSVSGERNSISGASSDGGYRFLSAVRSVKEQDTSGSGEGVLLLFQ